MSNQRDVTDEPGENLMGEDAKATEAAKQGRKDHGLEGTTGSSPRINDDPDREDQVMGGTENPAG